jgi:hypothetical protein
MKTLRFYMPGAFLISIALVIVIVPQILVAFMAAILVMAGIGLLQLGHILRKSAQQDTHLGRWPGEDGSLRWQFDQAPNERRWFQYR